MIRGSVWREIFPEILDYLPKIEGLSLFNALDYHPPEFICQLSYAKDLCLKDRDLDGG